MKVIVILMFVFMMVSVSASEEICDKAFFQLIEGNENIGDLREEVGENVSEEYITNYLEICKDFRQLPKPQEINITSNETGLKQTECDYELEREKLWGIFNLNKSFGDFITFGLNMDCDQINRLKWFVNVEKVENGYASNGVRIWWMIALVISIPFIYLFWTYVKLDKRMRRALENDER